MGLLSEILAERTTRYVFFSFHYQRDIIRAQQVNKHWVTKESHKDAGFFDGSLEEKAKKEGDLAVKRVVNGGLHGCSVTCVLIGAETSQRRWVQYEIFKSVESGMGVFGVLINYLKTMTGQTDPAGINPFSCLGYGTKTGSDKLWPMIHYTDGWKHSALNDPISNTAAPYLAGKTNPGLGGIFRVYDWVTDNGYANFSDWVAAAAAQAGR